MQYTCVHRFTVISLVLCVFVSIFRKWPLVTLVTLLSQYCQHWLTFCFRCIYALFCCFCFCYHLLVNKDLYIHKYRNRNSAGRSVTRELPSFTFVSSAIQLQLWHNGSDGVCHVDEITFNGHLKLQVMSPFHLSRTTSCYIALHTKYKQLRIRNKALE